MHASRICFKDIDDFFVAVAPELSYPPSPHCGHSYIILVDVYKTNTILTFLLEKSVVGSRWLQMSKNGSKWLQMGSRWAPDGLQVGSRLLSRKSSSRDTHYINKLPINRKAAGILYIHIHIHVHLHIHAHLHLRAHVNAWGPSPARPAQPSPAQPTKQTTELPTKLPTTLPTKSPTKSPTKCPLSLPTNFFRAH